MLYAMIIAATLGQKPHEAGAPKARKPYPFYGEGYVIDFPGKPNLGERRTRRKSLPPKMNVEEVPHLGDFRYWVADGQLKKAPADPTAILNALRDEAVEMLDGRVVSEEAAEMSDGHGRELVVQIPARKNAGPKTARVRVSLAGSWVFQVVSIQPDGKASLPEEADRYHASFRIRGR